MGHLPNELLCHCLKTETSRRNYSSTLPGFVFAPRVQFDAGASYSLQVGQEQAAKRGTWGRMDMAMIRYGVRWRRTLLPSGERSRAAMGAFETLFALSDALNAQDWDEVARELTDDFVCSGAPPPPVGNQKFIAGQQQLAAAAPDWRVMQES